MDAKISEESSIGTVALVISYVDKDKERNEQEEIHVTRKLMRSGEQ